MPQNELYPRPRGAVGSVGKPPRTKWGRTSYIPEPDFKRRLERVRRSWKLNVEPSRGAAADQHPRDVARADRASRYAAALASRNTCAERLVTTLVHDLATHPRSH